MACAGVGHNGSPHAAFDDALEPGRPFND